MEITSLLYFPFLRREQGPAEDVFLIYLLTFQGKAFEIKVTFNEILFEQSATSPFNNECRPRSGKMDFVGLIKPL